MKNFKIDEIKNDQLGEKFYRTNLDNGLEVIVFPKNNLKSKYIAWFVKYGSNDFKFKDVNSNEVIKVPDGVAHFLEHKMFEQKNGKNSLDVLTSLGVNANAYTCSTHTVYLFERIDNIKESLIELMDYVQNPYFTKDNVNKEKGIIGQEIGMYDDNSFWRTYYNLLKILYKDHPIKIDTAGTVESISKITDETLYKCYNSFYTPNNMSMVLVGDFDKDIIEFINDHITEEYSNRKNIKVEKININEQEEIVKDKVEDFMSISVPIFLIGMKLIPANILNFNGQEKVKREIALRIACEMLFGKTSRLYNKLYEQGKLLDEIGFDIDYSDDYSHIIFSGNSEYPEEVFEEFKKELKKFKNEKIDEELFNSIKKSMIGNEIRLYDNVSDIARNIIQARMNNINSFDYLEQLDKINIDDIKEVIDRDFDVSKVGISVTKPIQNN